MHVVSSGAVKLYSNCNLRLVSVAIFPLNQILPVLSPWLFMAFYRAAMLCNRGTSRGPVSVRVSPSVTSRCSIETDERIELVFGM